MSGLMRRRWHGSISPMQPKRSVARESSIELVREPGLEWYYRGLLWFTLCCALMVSLVWAGSALMVFLSSQAGG